MTRKLPSALLLVSLLLVLATVQPAFAAQTLPSATGLSVNLSFNPDPVTKGSQTQIQVSISGGTAPFYLWFNSSIPGCSPPSQPFQQSQQTSSYPCNATTPGTFDAHLDVQDSAGNHGSASGSLTVQSSSGGSGSNTGNGSGGFNLSGLQDLLPILMIVGIVFLASMVAIAASAVSMAILIPRRLKQLRKAIQGEPLKKVKTEAPKAPKPEDKPPEDDL